ncbi:peptidoglycan-binding protein [Nostocaceae cyanobacterium CENA369]|uniref:Peptidoglycan-binding protein n=1 Tax=Dendronalium phyllosphericum CENA369 TaxID=1725256 RepID=A0A8J7IAZ2_9NOST|nr:peptidoglycan-binding domain-containing protein [Dendronalium phyllosphericum]MBH8576156.1 peptidoglycan-binding protein [Dendronalium phyllosphericum CENA369]
MKGSLKASILNYLRSPKAFRFLSVNKFYWLLLGLTSVLIGSSGIVSIAAQEKIAQVNVGNNINRPTLKVGSQGQYVSELQAALKLLGFYSDTVNGSYNENTANAVSRFKQAVGLTPDGIVDAATWQRLFPNGPTTTATSGNSASNLTTFPVPTQPNTVVPTQTNTTQGAPPKPEPRPAKRKPNTTQRTQTTPKRPATPTRNTSNTRNTTTATTTTTRTNQIPGVQYTSEGWPILRVGMRNSEVTKLQQRLQRLGFLDGGIDGDFGVATEEAVKAAQKRYGLEPDGVVGGATWEVLLRRSPR